MRDNRPLLQSKRHTADENTDWLYLIRDCRLLFHKNDYSDEFIDTNYYKQNKQNDDFELYVTIDRFYKANATLPTKIPTDFDKYVTAAYYFTRTITVTNLLTPTITNKTNRMTTLNYTWQ